MRKSVLQKTPSDWTVVGVCLLLAALVWLATVLSKNYDYTISLPVRYDYDQEAFVSATPLPKRMKLQVQGTGWRLLLHEWGLAKEKLVIKPEYDPKAEACLVTPRHVYEAASRQIGDLQVTFALGDSVNAVLEPILKINLPLALISSELNLAEGFEVTSAPKLNPASLVVKGLKRDLAQLPPVLPVKLNTHKAEKDIEEVVPLDLTLYGKLKFSQKEVLVSFTVGKYVPWSGVVPVVDSVHTSHVYSRVFVRCLAAENLIGSLKPDSFKVILSGAKPGRATGSVRLLQHPTRTKDISMQILP